jgi:hypothetical protein
LAQSSRLAIDPAVIEPRIARGSTMRLTKTLGLAGALILSALVGGTLIGSTLATEDDPTTETTSTSGEYCEVFLDELAAELGTTRDGLTEAGKAAANAAIDAAVAAGDLSDERATALRERIAEADGDGCRWIGHGFGHGFARGFHVGAGVGEARGILGGDVFEAAADALGIERADLIGQLRDAGSLQALAESLGVSYDEVTASVLAAVQADLDAAVADGLPQERADAVIERLTTWLDEGGEIGDRGPVRGGFGPGGFGPGGFHRGPWQMDETESETETDTGA